MLEYATHRKILEKGQKVGRCTAEEYFFRELQRWFECLKKANNENYISNEISN